MARRSGRRRRARSGPDRRCAAAPGRRCPAPGRRPWCRRRTRTGSRGRGRAGCACLNSPLAGGRAFQLRLTRMTPELPPCLVSDTRRRGLGQCHLRQRHRGRLAAGLARTRSGGRREALLRWPGRWVGGRGRRRVALRRGSGRRGGRPRLGGGRPATLRGRRRGRRGRRRSRRVGRLRRALRVVDRHPDLLPVGPATAGPDGASDGGGRRLDVGCGVVTAVDGGCGRSRRPAPGR